MKKVSKFMAIALVAGLGFYNVGLSGTAASPLKISLSENYAAADDEGDPEEVKCGKIEDTTGSSTTTVVRDGKADCTRSFDYSSRYCLNTGNTSCTPYYHTSNETTDCDD